MISLLSFWRGVLGGRIPEVNGVLGGISAPKTISQEEVLEFVNLNLKRTLGKLSKTREFVVAVGLHLLFCTVPCVVFFRDDSRSLSSFRLW